MPGVGELPVGVPEGPVGRKGVVPLPSSSFLSSAQDLHLSLGWWWCDSNGNDPSNNDDDRIGDLDDINHDDDDDGDDDDDKC